MKQPSDELPPLREVIRRYGLSARKSLGQNFLLDLNLAGRIARAAGPLETVTVIEIGPGPGGLTRALLAFGASRVIAVERDDRAIGALQDIAVHYPGRLEIVAADALSFDAQTRLASGRARIVANLPYNIATALLIMWVIVEPWPPWYDAAVLMFQREVAERIVAKAGSNGYGRLSVLVQWRCEPHIVFDVNASAFVPPPKVRSSLVRLVPRSAPLPCDRAMLETVTQAAFGQRRKMLRQSLRSLGTDTLELIAAAGLDPTARAEEVSVEQFVLLARMLGVQRGHRAIEKTGLSGDKNRMSQFRRQSLVAYGEPLRETFADRPTPRGNEVLVRVACCGVCHSDLHVQDGYFSLGGDRRLDITKDRALPFTLGHEIAGVIEAAGESAEGVVLGREVAVYPWIGCGACAACRAGEENMCSAHHHLGVAADGGFATYVLVPHPRYLIDYAPLPASFAGPLMCSGLTAYAALSRLRSHAERGPVLLVGLGGVGMMGLALARALFRQPPLVADIDPEKRQAALAAGAAQAFDPADPQARRAVIAATRGGLYAVCDFVGSDKSLQFATGILARGGKVVVSGLLGGSFSFPAAMIAIKAIAIEGTLTGTLAQAREVIALARSGQIAPIPTQARPLDEAQAALEDLRAGRVVGRTVLAI